MLVQRRWSTRRYGECAVHAAREQCANESHGHATFPMMTICCARLQDTWLSLGATQPHLSVRLCDVIGWKRGLPYCSALDKVDDAEENDRA
jgi:hypothetical protein